MRSVVCACLIALTGCDKPAPAASPPASEFKPTAFTVEVTGHGRPVIFIPGLGCPGSVWQDTVDHLDGYQTFVLTLAGFAGHPRIDGELARETREQLAQYIRAQGLHAPVIVGHSLGGMIAYWLAETDPELVGEVVVVDSGAAITGDKAQGAAVRDMWNQASDEQYAQQVRAIFGAMAVHRDRLAKYLDDIQKSDRTAIGDTIYETYQLDLRDGLAHIHAPVLTMLADGSSQDAFKHDAAVVPDHTIVVVPDTGHFVMIDDPERFDATLGEFLQIHAPGLPVASR